MSHSTINSPDQLVTPRGNIVKGFIEQAIWKSEEAVPYVKKALEIYDSLAGVNTIEKLQDLIDDDPGLRDAVATASGLSEKAKGHMSEKEIENAITHVFEEIEDKEADDLRTIIFARYLLTKGDSFGGKLRNIIGNWGEEKFIDLLTSQLTKQDVEYEFRYSKSNPNKVNRILWKYRILFFNITPDFIGKSIDLILADCSGLDNSEKARRNPSTYLSLGELKGGIDPAGADEHWKTARSALERIREAFQEKSLECPPLFFIGAAVEAGMAREIYNHLGRGKLKYAANLTIENQVKNLAEWLISL